MWGKGSVVWPGDGCRRAEEEAVNVSLEGGLPEDGGPRRTSRSWPGRREVSWAGGAPGGWGRFGEVGASPPRLLTLTRGDCPLLSHQEHPFFTLHKTKKTDIAAFVKEILGEDS